MGFILTIIAYCLFFVVTPFNFIAVVITHTKRHGFWRAINDYWFFSAYDVDVFANYHFAPFWNLVLKKRDGYYFGVLNETISSALGKNQKYGTLSWFGWFVVYVLWACDYKYWRKGGHCINSINKGKRARQEAGRVAVEMITK